MSETEPTSEFPIDDLRQYLNEAIQSEEKLVPDELSSAMATRLLKVVPGPEASEQFSANVQALRAMVENIIADLPAYLLDAQKHQLCNRVMDAVTAEQTKRVMYAHSFLDQAIDVLEESDQFAKEIRARLDPVMPDNV